jgi:UPF0716 protein FxsA
LSQQYSILLFATLRFGKCCKKCCKYSDNPHFYLAANHPAIQNRNTMRFFIFAILLAFPLAEGALLYKLASGPHGHGGWVLAWVVFAAIAGIVLIKQARFSLIARLGQALSQGQFSIAAFIDSFRTVIAGLLLIFPGIISDIMALMILLIPIREPALAGNSRPTPRPQRENSDGVIEGEFRRER